MTTEDMESVIGSSGRKGRKFFPALCSVFGTVILLGVIAAFFPLTVPRLMGYNIYEVVSGSMEPAPSYVYLCVYNQSKVLYGKGHAGGRNAYLIYADPPK